MARRPHFLKRASWETRVWGLAGKPRFEKNEWNICSLGGTPLITKPILVRMCLPGILQSLRNLGSERWTCKKECADQVLSCFLPLLGNVHFVVLTKYGTESESHAAISFDEGPPHRCLVDMNAHLNDVQRVRDPFELTRALGPGFHVRLDKDQDGGITAKEFEARNVNVEEFGPRASQLGCSAFEFHLTPTNEEGDNDKQPKDTSQRKPAKRLELPLAGIFLAP